MQCAFAKYHGRILASEGPLASAMGNLYPSLANRFSLPIAEQISGARPNYTRNRELTGRHSNPARSVVCRSISTGRPWDSVTFTARRARPFGGISTWCSATSGAAGSITWMGGSRWRATSTRNTGFMFR
jgi:hypothetical protein